MHDYLVPVYATYLLATVALCAWLARTLYRNGALFLRDVFPDRPEMAEAVNHLLVTGFAMVNLGYGFFMMKASAATTSTEAFEVVAPQLTVHRADPPATQLPPPPAPPARPGPFAPPAPFGPAPA